MDYKKISVKDLVNVKKYLYSCKFEESFLNTIRDDIADYDVGYLWFKDSPHADKGYEFVVNVRHKETGLSQTGYMAGIPNSESVAQKILDFKETITLMIADGVDRHTRHTDKRKLYWL